MTRLPALRHNADITLPDIVDAVDYLLGYDAEFDEADGGTGCFAALPSGTPVTRWTVEGDSGTMTVTARDCSTFTITITGPAAQPKVTPEP